MADNDKNAPLRADVRYLGRLLGEVLREQVGDYLYELEEDVRTLTKNSRVSDQPQIVDSILAEISEQSPASLIDLTKAFGLYFQLVNIAEQNHRIRRKRHYEIHGEVIKYSLEDLLQRLQTQQISDADLQDLLNKIQIVPVLTAHPTHIIRQTLMQKHRRISRKLFMRELPLTPRERQELGHDFKHEISLLWQTSPFHSRRITVSDEVANLFNYFDESLWDTLPTVHQDFEDLLHDAGYAVQVPTMIRFGSWIGGDRDGHPYVTAKLTRETLKQQKAFVIKQYLRSLETLGDHYSVALRYQPVSDEFLASLETDREAYPELSAAEMAHHPQELYRQKINLMKARLQRTLAELEQPGSQKSECFYNEEQFRRDVQLLLESLRRHRGEATLRPVQHLLRQIEIFGFYLARLDIRQHAKVHAAAVSELLALNGVSENYTELNEHEKQALLLNELQNPRPLISPFHELSDESRELIDTFMAVGESLRTISPKAVTTWIISMCQNLSDILHVLLLAKETGLARFDDRPDSQSEADSGWSRLMVVPLFETVADLEAAPGIMKALFELPLYKHCLSSHQQTQEVMVGYSDSSKQGGILASTWRLYQAQLELTNTARDAQVNLRFFHGRGGTLSRGGGPSHHAILAQPPETLWGDIRLTEQGEVLSWKYSFPELAHRNLSVLLSAVIEVTSRHPADCALPERAEVMDRLASLSYDAYTALVHDHPDFVAFFEQATPLEAISHLNIGSRPSKRQATHSIEDLRAIPWVFSWMQSRCVLPAWYGVGTALEALQKETPDELNYLRRMYADWPFFRTFIDNLQMTLSTADLRIASCYADLAEPRLRESIWTLIEAEFRRTREQVLAITEQQEILENKETLKRSIALRNPYVDPLNYIQVETLRRLRAGVADEREQTLLQEALELSIMGVSEGLRNTG